MPVLSEGTARALEHLRCLGECGRRSRRDDGRERALRHRQHSGSRPCVQQRASPSARGKERRSGVSSDLWFPRIPSSRARKQLRLGCLMRAGDELVSLDFRVGNPSAIGRHQRVNFPASLLPVGATPTTSRRIATHGLRRKMARSRTEGMAVGHVFSSQEGQKPSPRWGSFFCRAGAAPPQPC